MSTSRITRKAALTVGLATAALLPLAAAAPALAAEQAHRVSAPASVDAASINDASINAASINDERGPVERVDDFYRAYSGAVRAGDNAKRDRLRAEYLSGAALNGVRSWEAAHGADGVLFAQNAPESVATVYLDAGAGSVWVKVSLGWGDGSVTDVQVRYSNVTQQIAEISGHVG
ncbi:hypothetical protein RKE29_06265 [Streptomyces sp. B1866]|uniref:hypothetical protein n=1 Tax=Streptomyces sp. B1866 TaxID=3075431 RepID=UPI00288D5E47|nr:hypothetical protein [Streptomyces sp. B1866]MDT3396244.1 hypothetical protein [Streptomyces sp. B1866]